MGVSWFAIDGTKSSDYGVYVSNIKSDDAPARIYEAVSVPGRNGDIIFDEGRYENIIVSYECGLINNNANLTGFRSWLMSLTGYHTLTDSYHENEYRLAIPTGGLAVETLVGRRIAKFRVQFNCKPQRFFNNTEQIIWTMGQNSVIEIVNPTRFPSHPLVRAYGAGTIRIRGEQDRISDGTDIIIDAHSYLFCDLDFDIQDAFHPSANLNPYVSVVRSGTTEIVPYPALKSGITELTLGEGIWRIEVSPRWWTL